MKVVYRVNVQQLKCLSKKRNKEHSDTQALKHLNTLTLETFEDT